MKYAIVETGGKQFRAVEGDSLEVDRLQVELGTSIKLERVLLLSDGETVTIGTPVVKDNPVWTMVVEHFRGPKVNIFNYSPKKRIRVKLGHRQNYTRLLVQQIGGTELRVVEEPVEVEQPAEDENAAELSAETEAVAKVEKKAAPKAEKKAAEKPAASAKKAAPKAAKKTAEKASASTAKATKAAPAAKKTAAKPKTSAKKAAEKPAPAKKPAPKAKTTAEKGESK